jgi:hypothetical protein
MRRRSDALAESSRHSNGAEDFNSCVENLVEKRAANPPNASQNKRLMQIAQNLGKSASAKHWMLLVMKCEKKPHHWSKTFHIETETDEPGTSFESRRNLNTTSAACRA